MSFERGQSISYKTACVPSEDTNQPALPRSVTRDFAIRQRTLMIFCHIQSDLSSLQTNTDTFANNVDPNETARSRLIRIDSVCHYVIYFCLKYLFATMDLSQFRDDMSPFHKLRGKTLNRLLYSKI